MINDFYKEYKDEYKRIDKKYLWENARKDRKYMPIAGLIIGIVITVFTIVEVTKPDISLKRIYYVDGLAMAVFVIYIVAVKIKDKGNNYAEVKDQYDDELRATLKALLEKYKINTCQKMVFLLDETRAMKKKAGIPDEYKNYASLVIGSLLIPAAMMVIGNVLSNETVHVQAAVLATIILLAISFLIVTVMVIGGIQELIRWPYTRLECHLKDMIVHCDE